MNQTLEEAYADEEKRRLSHILEAARRVREIVGDDLTREAAHALVLVLSQFSWEFPDGFVTDNEEQDETEIWAIDAAYITASLAADPDVEPWDVKGVGGNIADFRDPFAEDRELDDTAFALDHFECKLLKVADRMFTETGRAMARRRHDYLAQFRRELREELDPAVPSRRFST